MSARVFRGLLLILLVVGATLALAPSALAADVIVDQDTGTDASGCGNGVNAPCGTIGWAISPESQVGDTIKVDDSPNAYDLNNQSLFGSRSLVGGDFVAPSSEATGGRPIIFNSGGAGTRAVAVNGLDTAGTISGFTIRPGGGDGLLLAGTVAAVRDNVFEDPGATGSDVGIRNGGSSPTIENNTFTDLARGILVINGSPQIVGNDVSGARLSALGVGHGISLQGGSSTVTRNTVHDGAGTADGIAILGTGVGSAALSRNRVSGHEVGIGVVNAAGPVSLDSDRSTGNTEDSLSVGDSDDSGDSVVTATNVTAVGASGGVSDIEVDDGSLTLKSSIVGAPGSPGVSVSGATPSCSISFSRGPTTGAGCLNFQTTQDPMFTGDFHLQPGSPMIDAGDPTAPPGGALDIDGDPRALDGNGDGVVRRDIGADEAPAAAPDPTPTPPSNSFTIGKLKGKKLSLTVPGAGEVDVKDANAAKKKLLLKPSSATASGPGTVTVTLKLTKTAKKKLKAKGKVKVKAAITFTPTGGAPNTETKGLKVKK